MEVHADPMGGTWHIKLIVTFLLHMSALCRCFQVNGDPLLTLPNQNSDQRSNPVNISWAKVGSTCIGNRWFLADWALAFSGGQGAG